MRSTTTTTTTAFTTTTTSLVALLVVSCAAEPIPIPPECNGAVELCARRFDQVAYPTTHNAMSSEDDGWVNPNQYHDVPAQLEDGVRALMLDTHYFEDRTMLCHGVCQLGSQPLAEGLAEIADFLHHHRGEVVTIIFESYISADDTRVAFEDSGLADYLFRPASPPSPTSPWPTLRQLIDDDQRLVVLTDAEGGAFPWYLDVWGQAWETPFAAREITDFTCDPGRGDPANPLFIFNHFLTRTRPVPEDADQVNADPLLIDRARECMAASGSLPNFVTVDFYSVGDLFEAVASLNGLDP